MKGVNSAKFRDDVQGLFAHGAIQYRFIGKLYCSDSVANETSGYAYIIPVPTNLQPPGASWTNPTSSHSPLAQMVKYHEGFA